MKTNAQAKRAAAAANWAARIALMCVTVVALYPVAWNAYSSFKTSAEFLGNPFSLPGGLEWGNYARAFEKSHLAGNFLNSIYVTLLSVAILAACAIPCAYCLARFRFFASKSIAAMFMAAIFIRADYIMIPLFLQMNDLGLLDKLTPLALLYAVAQFPFSIFLLMGFIKTIPREYEEAARMDGCGNFGILIRIVAPMAKPGIVTVCMLAAMAAWNEFVIALVMVTDPLKQTIPVGLANLYEQQRYATDWGALFAALMLVLAPTIALYAVGQKYLIQGINVGGVKG
ncbi:MAG: carbohydrate ABC transporter permease [Clostridiales bacterium]|jgi:N-acetylglucosamine transport system permease protein|nr:carbohydrate ABC transporter permease [Clostridiales bacterium]